jgi:hypothetical protein
MCTEVNFIELFCGRGAEKEFDHAADELSDRLAQMTDNAGTTEEHRALNYLAVLSPRHSSHPQAL